MWCVAVRHAVCLMARYLRFYLPLFSVESPLISLWRTFNFVFPVQHFSVCTFPFFIFSSQSNFDSSLFLVFPLSGVGGPQLLHRSSPVFFKSLFTQSSPLSLGLPRLLLPSSRNSAALHPPSFLRVLPTVACSFGF